VQPSSSSSSSGSGSGSGSGDGDDDDDDDDDDHGGGGGKNGDEDDEDDEDYDTPLVKLAAQNTNKNKPKPKKVARNKLMALASQLVDAADVSPEMSITIHSSMLDLLNLARGRPASCATTKRSTTLLDQPPSVTRLIDTAYLAVGSKRQKLLSQEQIPVAARREAGGRPRSKRMVGQTMARHSTGSAQPKAKKKAEKKCSFCKGKKHAVNTCQVLLKLGKRIPKTSIAAFRKDVLSPGTNYCISDENKVKALLGDDVSPVGHVPKSTVWLVIHGVYKLDGNVSATSASIATVGESVIGVEISCYNGLGQIVESSTETVSPRNFAHRLATIGSVNDWIARHCTTPHGKGGTNVINGLDLVATVNL
jgi:hypothetical protein